ncbi:hypothetical protein Tco_1553726 [Tanacetum coccineum]
MLVDIAETLNMAMIASEGCSASCILDSEDQVVIAEDGEGGEGGASSSTVAANEASKAFVLKKVSKKHHRSGHSFESRWKERNLRWCGSVMLERGLKIPTQKDPLLQTAYQKEETWHVLLTRGKGKGLFWMTRSEQPKCGHLESARIGADKSRAPTESYVDAQGQSVFISRAWRRLFDIRGPLVYELILEFFSTFRFGEAVLDLDTAGALQFQLGRVRRRMSWKEIILALGLHTAE